VEYLDLQEIHKACDPSTSSICSFQTKLLSSIFSMIGHLHQTVAGIMGVTREYEFAA